MKQKSEQITIEQEKEQKKYLNQNEENEETVASLFTPVVIMWILCFIIMFASLVYKEFYLEKFSDDWRFFSAIHVITALICILGITIHNIRTQHVFDDDIQKIDSYIDNPPVIKNNNNKIYANDREIYETTLMKFQDYIQLAKILFFFGIIGLTAVFFIWDITQYFLAPDAYVVRLTSDIGWTISAHKIYILGLIISGGSIISAVILHEYIKSQFNFYTLIIYLGSLIDTISSFTIKAGQNNGSAFFCGL